MAQMADLELHLWRTPLGRLIRKPEPKILVDISNAEAFTFTCM